MADEKLALAREWLGTALGDLDSARRLAAGDNPIFATALFHCQQAAEKAVKGYLLFHDRRFEKTHDIRLLVTDASLADASFRQLVEDAKTLTPYAFLFRYPDSRTRPSLSRFENALAAAERVYRFVLAKHPELDPEKS